MNGKQRLPASDASPYFLIRIMRPVNKTAIAFVASQPVLPDETRVVAFNASPFRSFSSRRKASEIVQPSMKSILSRSEVPLVKNARIPPDPGPTLISVVTVTDFAAPVEVVWESLMFYEQIEKRSPWLLRLLLPVPLRTEGCPREVGDQIQCLYRGGYLIKRVTRITQKSNFAFDVIEQNLALGGGIRLAGGSYALCALPGGRTEVALETLYESPYRPRWLCQWIEARVCHLFHRHILSAMRDAVQIGPAERMKRK